MSTSSRVYKLDPLSQYDLALYLYKNVTNVPALLKKAKEGTLKCAILNPKIIYDPFQVVTAANRAVLALNSGTMITRNVYSEIIYCLSPTKNITKSLAVFGMSKVDESAETKRDILVVILQDKNEASSNEDTLNLIEGDLSTDDICQAANIEDIKKAYNVHNENILEKIVTMCAVKN